MDPPYGERMRIRDIDKLYAGIGEKLSESFKGWKATILTGNSELLSNIDMKPERTNTLWKGPIQCQAAHYSIFTDEEREKMIQKALEKKEARKNAPLTEGAEMAYNRLMKNISAITPIMEKEGVTCYRIYDADMPEYKAAIDIYEGKRIVLSEYAAPDTIEPETAERRLNELILATERATGIDIENIHVKTRAQQKGNKQYSRLAASNHQFLAKENGVKPENVFYAGLAFYNKITKGEKGSVFGRVLMNRTRGTINVFGLYANTVPVFIKTEEDFLSVCKSVSKELAGSVMHSAYPLNRILADNGIKERCFNIAVSFISAGLIPKIKMAEPQKIFNGNINVCKNFDIGLISVDRAGSLAGIVFND